MGNVKELIARQREINALLANCKEEERESLVKEYEGNKREIDTCNQEAAMKAAEREVERDINGELREKLINLREGKVREVEVAPVINTFASAVTASGTQAQNVHGVIGTLNEGLGLPKGCQLVGGVTGNDIWPFGVNDAEMEEVGENVALSEQQLDFDKLNADPRRAGVAIDISNKAIDEAGFDLVGYVYSKIQLAKRKYLAKKIYSQAAWTGVKGPFSGLTAAGTITIGATAYKAILKAVANFINLGLDGAPCLVMDAVTEAELKATPKAEGQGGFIIENGKCAGYDYVVSHYINTKLNTAGTALEATTDKYLGIGYWNYLAVQQHGKERLTTDGNSKGVAIKNVFNTTYNTEFSITDLSKKLNAKGGTTTQAFALYKLA